MSGKRTREREAFFRARLRGRRRQSRVRNATKYLIREFADSFSSSTKRKGWLRTDGRKGRMSYLDGCSQAARHFDVAAPAIFVPRCKSFYEVRVLSLFSKLDTKWIFLFLPSAVRRAYHMYRDCIEYFFQV